MRAMFYLLYSITNGEEVPLVTTEIWTIFVTASCIEVLQQTTYAVVVKEIGHKGDRISP